MQDSNNNKPQKRLSTMNFDITAKLPIVIVDSLDSAVNNNGNNNNSNSNSSTPPNTPYQPPPTTQSPMLTSKFANSTVKTRKKSTINKESYFHYIEPTPQQLLEMVEYDLDEKDLEWLKEHNVKSNFKVCPDDFEIVLDRLEKESYFESKESGKEVLPEVDEDAVCEVCNDGDANNTNAILFCDMCNLAVHQECYGVPYVPEGQWLCRRCLHSPSTNVDCILCPNKGGAFKQTDDNRWAHVICALWIPEVSFANTVFLEPVDNIRKIPQARWKLPCYICKQKKIGACIQCHKPNCYVPFHVTCAQQAGLYMKIQPCKYETEDGIVSDVKKEAFCDAHEPKFRNSNGGMYSSQDSSDTEEDDDARKVRYKVSKDKMTKTRKILAEKREIAFNPISIPTIRPERLTDIAMLMKKKPTKKYNRWLWKQKALVFMEEVVEYWKQKRLARNGVPLIRRLQVSYSKKIDKDMTQAGSEDLSAMLRLRFDLEKVRLLLEMVKKRENIKRSSCINIGEIALKEMDVADQEDPPNETVIKKETKP